MAKLKKDVQWAAIYGSIARGEESPDSDIDLLLVGDISMADLVPLLRRIERQFGREVNVTRYSLQEFRDKMRGGDHFLTSLLKGKLISLIGSLDELEKTALRK